MHSNQNIMHKATYMFQPNLHLNFTFFRICNHAHYFFSRST